MEGRVAGAEPDLRADAVDPRDVRVDDELDRAASRHEVPELVDRTSLDVDAGGREQDPVEVARMRVGHLLVERLPLAVERVERLLRPGERPRRPGDALPGGARIDVEKNRERALGEELARPFREDGAAAEGDDGRLPAGEDVPGDLLLERAESGLASALEQASDRLARARLDLAVEIDEAASESSRRPRSRRSSCPSP